MEKIAKEMFKELGYRIVFNNKKYIRYQIGSVSKNRTITFYLTGWDAKKYTDNLSQFKPEEKFTDIELHKAITKQMQELGWE